MTSIPLASGDWSAAKFHLSTERRRMVSRMAALGIPGAIITEGVDPTQVQLHIEDLSALIWLAEKGRGK